VAFSSSFDALAGQHRPHDQMIVMSQEPTPDRPGGSGTAVWAGQGRWRGQLSPGDRPTMGHGTRTCPSWWKYLEVVKVFDSRGVKLSWIDESGKAASRIDRLDVPVSLLT
jgi:hypothetical protein